ncbi:hypothetical protein E4U55_007540 [Claviceps digitariae]|nr:hypothetical protein E4U55_007540 [Claviceps digitariae]
MKLFIALLPLAALVQADTYANCGCAVNGDYNQDLADRACDAYMKFGGHARWGGYACIDDRFWHGINAKDMEDLCVKFYEFEDDKKIGSYCWH